jgi:hypothetical protein
VIEHTAARNVNPIDVEFDEPAGIDGPTIEYVPTHVCDGTSLSDARAVDVVRSVGERVGMGCGPPSLG